MISICQHCHADLLLTPWGRRISSFACTAVHRALPAQRKQSLDGLGISAAPKLSSQGAARHFGSPTPRIGSLR